MEAVAVGQQFELFPTLHGGRRPRVRRSRRRQKELDLELTQVFRQLELAPTLFGIPQGDSSFGWSDDEVKQLHMFLLERSMEILADARSGRESVEEILDWISANPTEPEQLGFSFRLCCAIAGYDEEALRDSLVIEVECLHGIAA